MRASLLNLQDSPPGPLDVPKVLPVARLQGTHASGWSMELSTGLQLDSPQPASMATTLSAAGPPDSKPSAARTLRMLHLTISQFFSSVVCRLLQQ